jgi:tetratricopeptide (TPR) repeat protein/TolB-like protein
MPIVVSSNGAKGGGMAAALRGYGYPCPPVKLQAGEQLGPYQVLALIGEGGMGEVYRARDSRIGRDVALKVLPCSAGSDLLRRFEQEARAAGMLNHPNVLTVYDVGSHEGTPFIISELLEGTSLRGYMSSRLPMRKAIDYAQQIARGLAAAHDKGIVHRDLKPENIFILDDGRVKLLDFGLVKLIRPEEVGPDAETQQLGTDAGTVLGTAGYMSPEQVRGEAADHRSDLFSFGAILYEMLTGRPAFVRRTVADTMVAILNGEVGDGPPATHIPPALESIVAHCVETDPAARFQSARDVAFDLESWLATTGRTGGRRLSAWGLAGAAIVTASIVAWSFAHRSVDPPAIGSGGRPAVAVMAFDNPSGVSEIAWLTRGVPSMLVTGLAQNRGLDVVSTSRLDEVVNAAGYGDLDRLDKGRRVDVARRAGAGALVTGTVFKVGDQIRLDVSVEEIASGHIIVAQSVRGADVFPLIDDLASRIARDLHVDDAERRPVADVTSPSIGAYRLFTEAAEALRNLRYSDTRVLLERAVAIDPGFAAAYSELAFVSSLLKDPASADKYRDLVWKHQDRLPPHDRIMLQLRTARDEGDSRKAVAIGERLTAEYPGDIEGLHMLGHAYRDVGELPRSLDVWRRAIRLAPYVAGEMHNDSGYVLLQSGRYDEALAELEEYRRLRPREANPYDSLAEAQVILGDPAKALEFYAAAVKIDSSFYQSHFGRAWSLAMLGRYDEALADADASIEVRRRANAPTADARLLKAYLLSRVGRYREATAACETALREAAAVSDLDGQVAAGILQVVHAIERGRYGEAARVARRWQDTSRLRESVRGYAGAALHLLTGTALARTGDLASARRELAAARSTASRSTPVELWSVNALEAEIALSAGDAAAARSAMAGEPARKMWITLGWGMLGALPGTMPIRDVDARATALAGDRAGAAVIYRRLLTQGRDQPWIAPLEPRFVFQLARTLDPIDPAAARIEYERFLTLWAHADPDLPELVEAKRRVAR